MNADRLSASIWITALVCSCIPSLRAEVYTVYPDHHSRVFSAQKEPVLRVKSGDTIITRTWDSSGGDYKGVAQIKLPYVPPERGNPLMGPFYIEGVEPGDALEVHLDKVRVNRNYGYTMYQLPAARLKPGDTENRYENFYKMDAVWPQRADLIPWDIDVERGVTSPRLLDNMRSRWKIEIPVRTVLGCIGVAPPVPEILPYGPPSTHGGNMDYNDVVEGASIYFPVYHQGAYLYVGDAHAVQGDGEALGAGIETSADVQMMVTVHNGKKLTTPRLVNDEYLISLVNESGKDVDTDTRLRTANSDMISWLRSECGLTPQEAHMLMGTVVQHKIVTYWGSTATLIPKKYVPKSCHQFWH